MTRSTTWVMEPAWLAVPSTLNTGIGFGSFFVGMRCLATKSRSRKRPLAPQSIIAGVDINCAVSGLCNSTGISSFWVPDVAASRNSVGSCRRTHCDILGVRRGSDGEEDEGIGLSEGASELTELESLESSLYSGLMYKTSNLLATGREGAPLTLCLLENPHLLLHSPLRYSEVSLESRQRPFERGVVRQDRQSHRAE